MQKLSEWSAGRSGAHITLNGKDEKGNPVRVTGVDRILAGAKGKAPVAVTADGNRYELA